MVALVTVALSIFCCCRYSHFLAEPLSSGASTEYTAVKTQNALIHSKTMQKNVQLSVISMLSGDIMPLFW